MITIVYIDTRPDVEDGETIRARVDSVTAGISGNFLSVSELAPDALSTSLPARA